ncbi:hypothetical protein [Qipengyuania sediminis]|uniref:hypothetical protein n=1 Tax=Qipengyuania sediminis TaxID=1532023 RepID=UPI00105AA3EE|nr:hypothetical protein [Qipengyuania sediminis]
MHSSVTILTGPKHSGKSSRLEAWAITRTDVGGLLQRAGAQGRYLTAIGTDVTVPLESRDPDEAEIEVGRFRFRQAAFDWANAHLARVASERGLATVILDEIGPLELEGGGIASGARAILAATPPRVVLVVREGLAEAAARAFAPYARVIAAEGWPQAVHRGSSAP